MALLARGFLLMQGTLMLFPAAMNLWLVYFGPSAPLIESLMLQNEKIVNENDFIVTSFGSGLSHLMASFHAIFGALTPGRSLVPNVLAVLATASVGMFIQISKPDFVPAVQKSQLTMIFGAEIVLGLLSLYFSLRSTGKKPKSA